MQSSSRRARRGVALVSCVFGAWAMFIYACNVEDENPAVSRDRGDGATPGVTTGADGEVVATGAPICAKYGGYDKVKTMASAVVARVSNDCRIGAPVAALEGKDATHFADCFGALVGGAFQCPGVSYVANTTVDSNGDKCRSLGEAHKGLNLRKADFEAFLEDIAAEFAAQGVSEDDIRAVAPVFEGARTSVVQTNSQPDRNTHCECADGTYEGKPCTVIVDAAVDTGIPTPKDAGKDAITDAPSDG